MALLCRSISQDIQTDIKESYGFYDIPFGVMPYSFLKARKK